MTAGKLAVVAVQDLTLAAAVRELRRRGARDLVTQSAGTGRWLVYWRLPDDETTRAIVSELREQGWSAAQRPSDDDPWIFAWRTRTQPVMIGENRLVVALPWAEFDRSAAPFVEIDPGGAFGAGTHPTTHLLLDALGTRLRGGETVLDVGCGSGVLAIAALRLGSAAAVGIDLEPAAVTATRANAERNGLGPQLTAATTPLSEVDGMFDVVLANIGLHVLTELAPDLERVLAPAGWLGLSGISAAQTSRLSAALPSIPVWTTHQLDDWAALIGKRVG